MNKLFNNILVPVGFSKDAEGAIDKAIEIANQFHCNLHLLHIEEPGLFSRTHRKIYNWAKEDRFENSETRLYNLQNKYTYKLNPGLLIQASLRIGDTEKNIAEYTIKHEIDLVVIGKLSFYSRLNFMRTLNINRLSRKIDCPVITVKTKPSSEKWSNIVLPVNAILPIRKIMFASYLAKKFNSRIHLIAISNKHKKAETDDTIYLYKAYQLLRDNTNLRIECHTVTGENLADSTLEYAQKVDADLIVVNPGKESLLPGFLNRFFTGFFFNEPGIPVMTVSPLRG